MMKKPLFLKFKRKCYLLILGLLQIVGFSFFFGCASSGNDNNKVNYNDSLKRVKEVKDSIAFEKHKKDSIAEIQKMQDSIARVDSINKIKKNKNHYKPPPTKCMYGIAPSFK